jgi:uncharacterized protein with HEPN domain
MPSEAEAVRRWLDDIPHHIDLAEDFVSGIDETAFADDLVRLYAVIRCLEIISEASRRLPDTLKARHPSIAWKEMAAAGNVYRHEYEGVAPRRVWQTLRLALPPLRAVIQSERAALQVP